MRGESKGGHRVGGGAEITFVHRYSFDDSFRRAMFVYGVLHTSFQQKCRLFRCQIAHVRMASWSWLLYTGYFGYVSSLNACIHSLRRKPGMHHNIQRGSIARAASTLPISAVSQPNWARIPATAFFATSSL